MAKWIQRIRLVYLLGFKSCILFAIHKLTWKLGVYKKWVPTQERLTSLNPILIGRLQKVFHLPLRESLQPHFNQQIVEQADRIVAGEFLYFFHHWKKAPKSWHENITNGFNSPKCHWNDIPDFDPQQGDIKWIWETSRMDWIYCLGRAYGHSNNQKYFESFKQLIRSWILENPPHLGTHWRDGQECALRSIALIWATNIFDEILSKDATLKAELSSLVIALSERIEVSLPYARSQRNNHALSEACALFVTSIFVPEYSKSLSWQRTAWKLFEEQVADQFDSDGWYIQHSFVYQRLALKLASIMIHSGQQVGYFFSEATLVRLRNSVNILRNLCDSNTGNLPNYGANDGTNIFCLSQSEYLDFRPIIQILSAQLDQTLPLPSGPWNEELIWWNLNHLKLPKKIEPIRPITKLDTAGVFILKQDSWKGFLRYPTFKSRPNHADALHFDFWIGPENILCDSGTFQYFDPHDWHSHFRSTKAHNTVVVNSENQMPIVSRFLWDHWLHSRRLESSTNPHLVFRASHNGYRRQNIVHTRSIYAFDSYWAIVDDLSISRKTDESHFELFWHLTEKMKWNFRHEYSSASISHLNIRVYCSLPHLFKIGESPRSLHYGQLSTAPLISSQVQSKNSFRWITILSPSEIKWVSYEDFIHSSTFLNSEG